MSASEAAAAGFVFDHATALLTLSSSPLLLHQQQVGGASAPLPNSDAPHTASAAPVTAPSAVHETFSSAGTSAREAAPDTRSATAATARTLRIREA